ncbi:hypothetical protein M3O57_07900 [Xanthomonas nasturtii]|nr:hypothetical protein [Xanthomonas nasturtii]MCL1530300.1 hypothetical protein [Xanthomonas nasturtii]MCL1558987.1 hypothetical protein [Xanthomonas nasturtii]MCL1565446.1 hypothetical protein [Xanthomonas nasturtii]MCL1569388.1 hypothetical protein [Xanthomonas nasturtii]MCL1573214.1 hypothetical protein [Xanthomonas nasturtii]
MKTNYIFLSGMEKCGTTTLAGWLTGNGIAQYLVEDIKEPHGYLIPGTQPQLPPPAQLPWLDASAGYSHSPYAISRLPEHGTRIVLCLRNPFERTWSSYRMKKINALQDSESLALSDSYLKTSGTTTTRDGTRLPKITASTIYQEQKNLHIRMFPRVSSGYVEQHFDAEIDRLRQGDFAGRLDYEAAFLMTRRSFPFMSVLVASFYYTSIKSFLDRYRPEDLILVSLDKLKEEANRAKFLSRLIGEVPETDDVKFGFSSRDLPFDEQEPNFEAPKFDSLRTALSYDLQQYSDLLAARGVATDLLDWDDLRRHLR